MKVEVRVGRATTYLSIPYGRLAFAGVTVWAGRGLGFQARV